MYSTYIQRIEIALLSDPWCRHITLNTDSRHSNTDKYSLTICTYKLYRYTNEDIVEKNVFFFFKCQHPECSASLCVNEWMNEWMAETRFFYYIRWSTCDARSSQSQWGHKYINNISRTDLSHFTSILTFQLSKTIVNLKVFMATSQNKSLSLLKRHCQKYTIII